MRKPPALRIPLPGGAVLTRPAGDSNGPLTCERCHAISGPAGVDTIVEFAEWSARHRGEVCQ